MEFRGETFEQGRRVLIDGNSYFNCTFDAGCILEFNGIGEWEISGCEIHRQVRVEFMGSAGETIAFMRFCATIPGYERTVLDWIRGPAYRIE